MFFGQYGIRACISRRPERSGRPTNQPTGQPNGALGRIGLASYLIRRRTKNRVPRVRPKRVCVWGWSGAPSIRTQGDRPAIKSACSDHGPGQTWGHTRTPSRWATRYDTAQGQSAEVAWLAPVLKVANLSLPPSRTDLVVQGYDFFPESSSRKLKFQHGFRACFFNKQKGDVWIFILFRGGKRNSLTKSVKFRFPEL